MKKLIALLLTLALWMPLGFADSKTTDLTADTSPSTDDLVETVNDPAGTPGNRKVTLSDLRTLMQANLGTMATQAASSVSITGGSVTGITDLTVADGGTGASTAAGARTNLQIAANMPGYQSGVWYISPLATSTQGGPAVTANLLYASPIYVSETLTTSALGIYVTTGAASTNVRMGIYNCANGIPTSLVVDAGTGSTSSSAVTREISVSQVLTPGWYFIAAVFDGTPTLRAQAVNRGSTLGISGGLNGVGVTQYTAAHTYGALPATFPTVTADSTSTPLVLGVKF